jgi:hypothetical protein
LLQDLRYGGLPSLEDQHRDGSATETIKTARNLGPLRVLHRFAEAGLARAGWADMIYVLARRT